jgi:hypothetical protein
MHACGFLHRFKTLLMGFLMCVVTHAPAREEAFKIPPISVPVTLIKVGNIATFDFEAKRHLSYVYFLRFGFNRHDQAERSRMRKLLGGHEVDKSGKVREPGIPTLFKMVVTRLDNVPEQQVCAHQINPVLTSWGDNSFDKQIGRCDLPVGKYRVRLENLRSSPEFSGVPIHFILGFDTFKIL